MNPVERDVLVRSAKSHPRRQKQRPAQVQGGERKESVSSRLQQTAPTTNSQTTKTMNTSRPTIKQVGVGVGDIIIHDNKSQQQHQQWHSDCHSSICTSINKSTMLGGLHRLGDCVENVIGHKVELGLSHQPTWNCKL